MQLAQPTIVHLGLGAFAKAHLAAATQRANERSDEPWQIFGVSLRHPGVRDALAAASHRYRLVMRDADARGQPREQLQHIDCVRQCLVAQEDPLAVAQAIAAPHTKIISLTVTEKGYLGTEPGTSLHTLARGLDMRRKLGHGGATLMSLDNLAHNGWQLRERLLALAGQGNANDATSATRATSAANVHGTATPPGTAFSPELAGWIAANCTFPSSMVDRIVPRWGDGKGADVQAEPYFEWVVEDQFAAGRPAWERAGVRLVQDAEPWETLKLRMVNGSHTAIACLGVLASWATVDTAMQQPELVRFIQALMHEEVAPTLPPLPGLSLPAYSQQLLSRFANPALAHSTRQIAMDSSQKLPPRLLSTVRKRLDAGQRVQHLALAVAAWLHHLRGVDESGQRFELDDPLAAELKVHAARIEALPSDAPGSALARAKLAIQLPQVFGDLAESALWAQALAAPLQGLRQQGVSAALAAAM